MRLDQYEHDFATKARWGLVWLVVGAAIIGGIVWLLR
jgi:hypothetical protein